MKLKLSKFLALLFALGAIGGPLFGQNKVQKKSAEDPEVAVVYYQHWMTYPHGEAWKGYGWTEWNFVKDAKPMFPGHRQPKRPYLNYPDCSNPADVAMEIDLASENGVDVFLYCWYWYSGVKNMEEAIEKGFLKAPNNGKMKFAIMWANHDRIDQFRPEFGKPRTVWLPIRHNMKDSLNVLDYCIEHYFKHPSYWHVGGRPYFAIYRALDFIKQMGGAEKTSEFFAKAAEKMKSAGLAPIHWAGIAYNPEEAKILKDAGFDSTFRYNITMYGIKNHRERISKGEWIFNYKEVMEAAYDHCKTMADSSPIPNIPIVTQGWDSTPRCRQNVKFPPEKIEYPYGAMIVGNNADMFEESLRKAKELAKSAKNRPPAVLINAWNEWTEGSAIAPERREGMEFLRAISRVFGKRNPDKLCFALPYGKRVSVIDEPTQSHVKYGPHPKQFIDFWRAKSETPAPTVVYLHGGGWVNGSNLDERLLKFVLPMLKKGFNVASVEYRFIEDANVDGVYPPVKAPVDDAAAALNFLKSKASEWNIDTSRIALMGGSAGACSSLITALSDAGSLVKMVSVWVPQTSLDPKQMREWDSGVNYGHHAFMAKSFDAFLADREKLLPLINKYSPYALIRKGAPAIYMTFPDSPDMGEKMRDSVHSPNFGPMFKAKCDSLGVVCKTNYGASPYQAVKDVEENL